jgi:hypothetical protein
MCTRVRPYERVGWCGFGGDGVLEHLQEFAKIYLANLVFCQLLKSYAK